MDRKKQNKILSAYLTNDIDQAKAVLDEISVEPPDNKSDKASANKIVKKAAEDLARRLSLSHPSSQASDQTGEQFDSQTDKHPSPQSEPHSNRQPVSHTFSHTDNQSSFKTKSILSAYQRRVLQELVRMPSAYTGYPELEAKTGVKFATIRYCLKIFLHRGIISKPRKFRNGMHQGLIISVNKEEANKYLYHSDFGSIYQTKSHSDYHSNPQPDNLAVSPTVNLAPPYKEEEDNIFINLLLSRLPEMFPNLTKIGFEAKQLKEIILSWHMLKIPLDHLPESLDRIDWAVSNKKINAENHLNYVYKSLMRGPFAKPPGFVSRAEEAANAEIEEANQIVELKKKAFEAKFQAMMSDPESDTYQKCLAQLKDIERKRRGGHMFEMGMRRGFKEIHFECESPTETEGD